MNGLLFFEGIRISRSVEVYLGGTAADRIAAKIDPIWGEKIFFDPTQELI